MILKRLLLIACLLLPSAAWAGSNAYVLGGGVAVSAANGSVGSSTTGAGGGFFTGAIIFQVFTATAGGSVSYAHVSVELSGSDTIAVAIYDTDGSRLAYGSGAATGEDTQWVNISLNTTITISVTDYWLAVSSPASWEGKWIGSVSAGPSVRYDSSAYSNPLPTSITNDGEATSNAIVAIIFNNSASSPS